MVPLLALEVQLVEAGVPVVVTLYPVLKLSTVVPLGQGEVPAGGGGHVDVVDCEGLPVILTH